MRIAQVRGTVTLNRCHPTFVGARLKLVVPLSLADLGGASTPAADDVVAWDELGAGLGDRIALSEGAEAAQPFRPDNKPVDVYNAAILDRVEIREAATSGG
jgi:ethanolamine utilization protein EutN